MRHAKVLSLLGLATAASLMTLPNSFAGSERWIFSTSSERMQQEQMIHVRFADAAGNAVESAALKQMVINDCAVARNYGMPDDYKLGFSPEGKRIGIFLPKTSWQHKELCFTLPDKGEIKATIPAQDVGKSITLSFIQ